MMFENDLAPDQSLRSQVLKHLPLAAIGFGVLAAFVAMHVALTGVVIAALAHVVLGLVLMAVRSHRKPPSPETA